MAGSNIRNIQQLASLRPVARYSYRNYFEKVNLEYTNCEDKYHRNGAEHSGIDCRWVSMQVCTGAGV